MPLPSSPIPTASDPSAPPPEESRWRVGTLVYNKRGLIHIFQWLLWGDFAWSVRDRSIGPVLQLLLVQFKASNQLMSILTGSLPAVISLLLGPVVSYRSDRYRSRRGRRIPFLLISAPVAAVAIFGLGFSPWLGRQLHAALGTHSPGLSFCVLAILAVWWIVFDFATAVTNSVFNALINDVVPHGVIGRFYGLFRAVSLLVGIAFNYYLLAKAEDNYQLMFVLVAAVYGVGVVWMCLQVQEGEYPPPPPAAEGNALGRFFGAVRMYLRQCFSQPYYLWYFLASTLGILATSPINLFSVAYTKSLHMGMDTYGKVFALTYAISFCLTYILGALADRFHPLRLSMVAISLYGVSCLLGGFFIKSPNSFAVALLAHGVLSGTYFTAAASLGQRLLPPGSFAQLASAGGMIGSLCNIVLPLILGFILDRSHSNYRLTYYAGFVLSAAALFSLGMVYRYWKRYGGPHHYVAPEVSTV